MSASEAPAAKVAKHVPPVEDNDFPRQRIPKLVLGGLARQGTRGGGTRLVKTRGRRPRRQDFFGEYEDCPNFVLGTVPTAKQYPLTEQMEKLFWKYIKYKTFWDASILMKDSARAGKEILGVEQSRSYAIMSEINSCWDDNSSEGVSLDWFRCQYMEGVRKGETVRGKLAFLRGRETLPGPKANVFYRTLLGDEDMSEIFKEDRSPRDVEQVRRNFSGWKLQVAEFYLYGAFTLGDVYQ